MTVILYICYSALVVVLGLIIYGMIYPERMKGGK